MKKVAILQSNYIPWKGYFDLIAYVNEFILFDDMQFTKNDWRNRNQIKTPTGNQWLTIPVGQSINRRIRDVEIIGNSWQKKHWRSLQSNYSRSKYFDEISNWLEPLYLEKSYTNLSEVNRLFIESISHYLGIFTKISSSSDYRIIEGKTERLIDICLQSGGSEYISGLAAKNYLDEKMFFRAGIKVSWFNYDNYPVYRQLWGNFTHSVSILDLLFNCGKEAPQYMRYIR